MQWCHMISQKQVDKLWEMVWKRGTLFYILVELLSYVFLHHAYSLVLKKFSYLKD